MNILKRLALSSVAVGLRLPETKIDRILEFSSIKAFLKLVGVNCVLDVGANAGQFASELRGLGFKGRIVSFEPVPSEFLKLQNLFARDREWRGFQLALGDSNGVAAIKVVPQLTVLSSFLDLANDYPRMSRVEVQVRRLDDLYAEVIADVVDPKILLKMDTQGYDLKVFAGAAGCMLKIDALISELSVIPGYVNAPNYLESLSEYEQAGFKLYGLSVVGRAKDGGLGDLNCLMRR